MVQFFVTVVFLLSFIYADDFLISYQADIVNATLVDEHLFVTPAMIKNKNIAIKQFSLEIKNRDTLENLKQNKNELIEALFIQGIKIKSYEKTNNCIVHSYQRLQLPAIYIKTSIINDQLLISVIE